MKQRLSSVPLFNRRTGQFESAELFHGVDRNNLAHIEGRWRPLFVDRIAEAKREGLSLSDIDAEDAHWEWGKKALAARENPLSLDVFAIECAGGTQAIMLTHKGGPRSFSRLPSQERLPLVYIGFVATAPWNRPGLVTDPVYKGCGRILISTAISLSFDEEFGGRISLHSLERAEAFYRDHIGMTDLGPDDDYPGRLTYFELLAEDAERMFD